MFAIKTAAFLSAGATASSNQDSFATDAMVVTSLPTFDPMAVPAKIGAMIGTTASDAAHAEDIFGNTFGTAKLEMSPELKRKLRFARQVAGVHEDQFSWNRAPENVMPTREEVEAKKAAEVLSQAQAQAKQAAAAEAAAINTTKEEMASTTQEASPTEIVMSDYSMSFLPCIIFLFIIVVAIFAATLGAFWERAWADQKTTQKKGMSKEEFQALLKNQSGRRVA